MPEMSEALQIPSSFSLTRKGKHLFLLKEEYKDLLLQMGISDIEAFLSAHSRTARYLSGRTPHPSIPLTDGRRMVVRRYSHGGLLGAFTGDLYLFGSRSFRELSLTEEIRSSGIETLQVLGAVHRSVPPFFYRAYLFSLEIPEALNLVEYLRQEQARCPRDLSSKRRMIREIGLLLRRFHDAGFFHRDLQLKNILVVGDRPLLIDFDRSYRKQMLSVSKRMKNLLRLNRSAEKWKEMGLPITKAHRWRLFSAYATGDETILMAGKRAWRTYPVRRFLYRWSWSLRRLAAK
jgi:3-deoxy-D-manno-octulosonic acid kinase